MIICSSVILTRHRGRYNFCHRHTQLELDIAATLTSVPHRRLIGKLESNGVKGKILNWTRDFLSESSQVIKVKKAESSYIASVHSRIPQGVVF